VDGGARELGKQPVTTGGLHAVPETCPAARSADLCRRFAERRHLSREHGLDGLRDTRPHWSQGQCSWPRLRRLQPARPRHRQERKRGRGVGPRSAGSRDQSARYRRRLWHRRRGRPGDQDRSPRQCGDRHQSLDPPPRTQLRCRACRGEPRQLAKAAQHRLHRPGATTRRSRSLPRPSSKSGRRAN